MHPATLGFAAAGLRFLTIGPAVPLAERVRQAALFGAGHAVGGAATRWLLRTGSTPLVAGSAVAAAGALGGVAASGVEGRELAYGLMWGAGTYSVAASVNPNWPLGLRPRIFVSHSFADTSEYVSLRDALDAARLRWFDHSVPVFDQFQTRSPSTLRFLLARQIQGTSAVVLLARPGVLTSPCVRDELQMAVDARKAILLVEPGEKLRRLPARLRRYPLVERVDLSGTEVLAGLRRVLSRAA